MLHLKRYFLFYAVTLLMIFLVAGSYHRFMVTHDYLVYYEAECDPYTEQCFIYCEDEECSDPSYYKEIVRKADKLISICGDNISECASANECSESEVGCEVTYCDPAIEENTCEDLNAPDTQAKEGVVEEGGAIIEPEL